MIDSIRPGEIIYCNVYLKTPDGKVYIVKDWVCSRDWDLPFKIEYKMSNEADKYFLEKNKIKSDAKVINIDVIKHLGFKNKK